MQGDNFVPQRPAYGTKSLAAAANKPGGRDNPVSWTDTSGNLWMFSGLGYSGDGHGYLNDLWKYVPATGQWTWMSGDSTVFKASVYGLQGVAASANKPGARYSALSWTDASDNLWLFGGFGYASGISSFLNDLWKYVPSTGQWTWMSGDTTGNRIGIYGSKGVSISSNKPGGRSGAVSWTDASGNLWLFGGYGYGANTPGALNDLWKYVPSTGQWIWMNGDTAGQKSVYGTKGTASPTNTPGGRQNAVGFTDTLGNLWLFGGNDSSASFNDLWMYQLSTGQWTWISGDSIINQRGVYGTKGVATSTSKPGGRYHAVSWADASGNLWLFGGSGYSISRSGNLSDLWKYVPSSGQWTWMSGDSTVNQTGVYGNNGIATSASKPGGRYSAVSWKDTSGNLWLLGGIGYAPGNTTTYPSGLNDLWKYVPSTGQWTWMSGDNVFAHVGYYGTKGVAASTNKPGERERAVSWTDSSGNFWLFGGAGYDAKSESYLNDLWKYTSSTGQWTWISGDSTVNSFGVYGIKGIAASANKPGARAGAISWTDASGNLWLFGGDGSIGPGSLNDLWKFAPLTREWTWMSGDNPPNQTSVYGVKGTPDPANKPAGRFGAVSWTDASGNLWLLGGFSQVYISPRLMYFLQLNDLWKYTPSIGQWTWMSDDKSPNQTGVYGIKGTAALANKPGSRYGAVSWTDTFGNLWLFGGSNNSSYFNDLWKYVPSVGQWTWMSGDNSLNQVVVYGKQGTPSNANMPGRRYGSVSFIDTSGNLWLFGGTGVASNSAGDLNDLWKYVPLTGQWTWMKGDSTVNQTGVYGIQGSAASTNNPGGRLYAVGWTDTTANLWLFGGNQNYTGYFVNSNDLWKYSITGLSLPVHFVSFTAHKQLQTVLLSWTTAQEQNSRYFIVERTSAGAVYDSIGVVSASGTISTAASYFFTDIAPLQGDNLYRLKQLDVDGRFIHSKIVKVHIGEDAAGFSVIQNPVQNILGLQVQLSAALKMKLQVRDISGHLLVSEERMGSKGSSVYSISIDHLARGTYLINVQTENMNITKRFIKQ